MAATVKYPSAYACVYANINGRVQVLTAKKRGDARWRESDPDKRYDILNNPNQPVFPGGEMKKKVNGQYQEIKNPIEGANMEFLEETGYDLDKINILSHDWIAFDSGSSSKSPQNIGTKAKPQAESVKPAFYGVYVQLSPENFNSVANKIKTTIKAQNDKGFDINNVNKTIDDELAEVITGDTKTALAAFTNANSGGKSATDWFAAIVKNIPGNSINQPTGSDSDNWRAKPKPEPEPAKPAQPQ